MSTRKVIITSLLCSIFCFTASIFAYHEYGYDRYMYSMQEPTMPRVVLHHTMQGTPRISAIASQRDHLADIKEHLLSRYNFSTDDCFSWSASQFAAYFKHYLYHKRITPDYIFNLYGLYMCDEFLAYMQTLPGYEDHIGALYNAMQGSSANQRVLMNRIGCGQEWLSNFLNKSVECIYTDRQNIAQAAKEAEDKKQAELEQRVRLQAERRRRRQQELNQQEELRQEQACKEQLRQEQARKDAIKNFAHFNLYEQTINALEVNKDYCSVAMSMGDLAKHVFASAQTCNYNVAPEVASHTRDLINGMRSASHSYELAFNVAMTDQVLHDIQQKAVMHAGIRPTLFDRSPALLARAVEKFICRLNPVTQVTNWANSLIDIARFTSTITVGRYYLSEAEYMERINGYWSTYEALSLENFASLTAEQWVDLGAELAADMVFGMGVGKAAVYLKEIQAVAKTQQKATHIASRMKKAVAVAMKDRSLGVTAEGAFFHVAHDIEKIGGNVEKVGEVAKSLILIEEEARYSKPVIMRTVKGTGERCRIVRPLSDIAAVEWADKKYEAIRNCVDDIEKIAANTKQPQYKIKRIKKHLFYDEHMLNAGIMRFDPDVEIAAAWDRLTVGDTIKSDIALLEHEYFESKVEKLFKTTYDAAHRVTNRSKRKWYHPVYEDY